MGFDKSKWPHRYRLTAIDLKCLLSDTAALSVGALVNCLVYGLLGSSINRQYKLEGWKWHPFAVGIKVYQRRDGKTAKDTTNSPARRDKP